MLRRCASTILFGFRALRRLVPAGSFVCLLRQRAAPPTPVCVLPWGFVRLAIKNAGRCLDLFAIRGTRETSGGPQSRFVWFASDPSGLTVAQWSGCSQKYRLAPYIKMRKGVTLQEGAKQLAKTRHPLSTYPAKIEKQHDQRDCKHVKAGAIAEGTAGKS